MYMDTLLAVTRGVGAVANALREGSATCADGACQLRPFIDGVGAYITRALFATITNANFDDSRLRQLIADGLTLCDRLKTQAREAGIPLPQIDELALPVDSVEQIVATTGRRWRVSRHAHTEDGALREFVLYGLKGMAGDLPLEVCLWTFDGMHGVASIVGRTGHPALQGIVDSLEFYK